MNRVLFLSRRELPAWVPPTGRVLAYFHGGRIFTETLPYLARVALFLWGVGFAFWWLADWALIFRDHERWNLVAATVVHFAVLSLAYLFGRIAWVRLGHLRRIPPGESAALRSLPILLRLSAELFFVFAVALSVRGLLMPGESWPPVLATSGGLGRLAAGAGNAVTGLAFGAGLTLSIALWSLLGLVAFYGLANAIEVYLAIELNTRHSSERRNRDDDSLRRVEA